MLEQENLDHICTIKNCHPIFGQEIRHRRIIVKSNKDVFAVYFRKCVAIKNIISSNQAGQKKFSPHYAFLGLRPKRALSQI